MQKVNKLSFRKEIKERPLKTQTHRAKRFLFSLSLTFFRKAKKIPFCIHFMFDSIKFTLKHMLHHKKKEYLFRFTTFAHFVKPSANTHTHSHKTRCTEKLITYDSQLIKCSSRKPVSISFRFVYFVEDNKL